MVSSLNHAQLSEFVLYPISSLAPAFPIATKNNCETATAQIIVLQANATPRTAYANATPRIALSGHRAQNSIFFAEPSPREGVSGKNIAFQLP